MADAAMRGGCCQTGGHRSGRTALAAAAALKRPAAVGLVGFGAQGFSSSSAACKCETSSSLRATAARPTGAAGSAATATAGSCLCFAPVGSTC